MVCQDERIFKYSNQKTDVTKRINSPPPPPPRPFQGNSKNRVPPPLTLSPPPSFEKNVSPPYQPRGPKVAPPQFRGGGGGGHYVGSNIIKNLMFICSRSLS